MATTHENTTHPERVAVFVLLATLFNGEHNSCITLPLPACVTCRGYTNIYCFSVTCHTSNRERDFLSLFPLPSSVRGYTDIYYIITLEHATITTSIGERMYVKQM